MIRGNIIFSEKAATDLESITYWYNQQKNGLADDFLQAIDKILARVEKHPTSFRFIKKNVRRCTPQKFPYHIYFSFLNGIEVLRVRHVKQNL